MNEEVSYLHGRRVLLYFVLFFLTFCTADAIMVTMALKSSTGIVTEQSYEKGLTYNQTVMDAQKQDDLGWQSDILYHDQILRLILRDKSGQPLNGAVIKVKVTKPVDSQYDQVLFLAENAPGHYEAPLQMASPGLWHVRAFVQWQGQDYQASRVLMDGHP